MDTLRSVGGVVSEGLGWALLPQLKIGQFVAEKAIAALGRQNQPAPAVQPLAQPQAQAQTPVQTAGPVQNPPQPRQLPPGSYDVATITPEQLDALKHSKDPKDHALAATIQRSKAAYGDLMKNGSQIIANRQDGNDGQPVLTLLPPGFDPGRETRVHTHYHGYSATVADSKNHGAGLTNRIAEIQQRGGPQTVIVLPECANAQSGKYSTNWSNVKSQTDTTEGALKAAGVTNPTYRVVSAHSGGGDALTYALAHGKNGAGVQADRLELQDCFYGSQGPVAQWAQTPNGQAVHSVVYLHGTNDASDAGVRRAFGKRYVRQEYGNHDLTNKKMDAYPD
ncbi:hypothetical protein JST97_12125 [bacterium]|nr:hypothetical protein [bacterium]